MTIKELLGITDREFQQTFSQDDLRELKSDKDITLKEFVFLKNKLNKLTQNVYFDYDSIGTTRNDFINDISWRDIEKFEESDMFTRNHIEHLEDLFHNKGIISCVETFGMQTSHLFANLDSISPIKLAADTGLITIAQSVYLIQECESDINFINRNEKI